MVMMLSFQLRAITLYQSPSLGAHTHSHAHAHAHVFWVGMGAMLLFMGGHLFCASLHPVPNQSQTSRMQGIH
jgi:hypothetical protein